MDNPILLAGRYPLMTGDVSKMVNLSSSVVLWHVRRGRLSPVMTPAGRRIYDPADVAQFAAWLRSRERRGRRTPAPAA
jgi:DNA-binding transcriptional MerR regulator